MVPWACSDGAASLILLKSACFAETLRWFVRKSLKTTLTITDKQKLGGNIRFDRMLTYHWSAQQTTAMRKACAGFAEEVLVRMRGQQNVASFHESLILKFAADRNILGFSPKQRRHILRHRRLAELFQTEDWPG